eukprot:4193509-Amphidinium_carterae.1
MMYDDDDDDDTYDDEFDYGDDEEPLARHPYDAFIQGNGPTRATYLHECAQPSSCSPLKNA